jgi:hypothetical protein
MKASFALLGIGTIFSFGAANELPRDSESHSELSQVRLFSDDTPKPFRRSIPSLSPDELASLTKGANILWNSNLSPEEQSEQFDGLATLFFLCQTRNRS